MSFIPKNVVRTVYLMLIIVLLLTLGCATYYQKNKMTREVYEAEKDDDGIIYLDENEEPISNKKKPEEKQVEPANNEQSDDGIIYIDENNEPVRSEPVTFKNEVNEPEKYNKPIPERRENISSNRNVESGKASYYADKFQGRPTASGEPYDKNKMTAAHRTLPFGTICKVTNVANGKTITVKVNDRGPHVKTRVIDLSYRAMRQLDGISAGLITVEVEVIK